MKELEIKNYFTNSPKEEDLDKIIKVGQVVAKGLTLEKGTPTDYYMERFQIVGVITETLIETSEILDIKIPKVGKIYEWGDVKNENAYFGITALAEPDEIKFSPTYLKRIALGFNRKGPGSNNEINSLVNTAAHEMFHVWQWKEFPEKSQKDFENYTKWYIYAIQNSDFSLNEIPKPKSEREAIEFAKQIEKARKELKNNYLK